VASVWITPRATKRGERRFRVEFRLAGRGAPTRYGGSFRTLREASTRKGWIAGEIAALRVPNLDLLAEAAPAPTIAQAAERWLASRVDLAENTLIRHRLELQRIGRLLGGRRVDELAPADVAAFVATLTGEGYARGSTRKTLQTVAMLLDHAGVTPNPARDKQVRLPREEPVEINPPTAAHVEAVYRLLPSKHRLPLLWLDWSGARVSSVDLTLISDYDEPRRRVRLRAATTKTRKALWVDLHPVLADALEARLGPREDRNPDARLFSGSGADALRTSIAKACKATAIPLFSPHDLRHRRDISVTADVYSHVLADETEIDYESLLKT
jgi:integrase